MRLRPFQWVWVSCRPPAFIIYSAFPFPRKWKYDESVEEYFVDTSETTTLRQSETHETRVGEEGETEDDEPELFVGDGGMSFDPKPDKAPAGKAAALLDKARDDATSFLDLLTEKHATVSSWLSELDGTCNPRVQQFKDNCVAICEALETQEDAIAECIEAISLDGYSENILAEFKRDNGGDTAPAAKNKAKAKAKAPKRVIAEEEEPEEESKPAKKRAGAGELVSSQKPRPKRNYNSTAQHAHIFKGQLTLCLARFLAGECWNVLGLYEKEIGGKAEATYSAFRKHGLSLAVKVTKSAIGSEPEYPWIKPSDFIRYMDESKRLDLLLGDYKSLEDLGPVLKTFWSRFQKMSPNHDVFKQSKAGKIDLSRSLPYYIHADEGRTLKKKAIFLLQWQVAFGKGVGQRLSAEEVQQKVKDLKLRPNFNGHAYTTRFLAATMLRSDYSNSPEMLEGLLELIVQDLASLGWQGIQLSVGHLWMVALGNKGDWSYLVDIANLSEHPAFLDSMPTVDLPWDREGPTKDTKQQPYIQKISKDTLGCHSLNEMPDGHWHKGSTTTVLCKYVQHLSETQVDRVSGCEVFELIASCLLEDLQDILCRVLVGKIQQLPDSV
ncbi:unnamed protein product [Symbiodinium microadriaticum]|nr:unnamed protein product [Symbiodinium microadriaticum]